MSSIPIESRTENQSVIVSDSSKVPSNLSPRAGVRSGQSNHWAILAFATLAILLSAVLKVRDDQRVEFLGLAGVPLPETCAMRTWFHHDCPGCGLTRSFIHLAHGDWNRSLSIHRFGWLVALTVVLQFPYRWYLMRNPSTVVVKRIAQWFACLVLAIVILNWLANEAIHFVW